MNIKDKIDNIKNKAAENFHQVKKNLSESDNINNFVNSVKSKADEVKSKASDIASNNLNKIKNNLSSSENINKIIDSVKSKAEDVKEKVSDITPEDIKYKLNNAQETLRSRNISLKSRKNIGIACSLIFVVIFIFIFFSGKNSEIQLESQLDNKYVKLVRNSVLQIDKSMTIGNVFDSYKYIENPTWKFYETERGQKIVEFLGDIKYFGLNNNELYDFLKNEKIEMRKLCAKFIINIDNSFELGYLGFKYRNQYSDSYKKSVFLESLYKNNDLIISRCAVPFLVFPPSLEEKVSLENKILAKAILKYYVLKYMKRKDLFAFHATVNDKEGNENLFLATMNLKEVELKNDDIFIITDVNVYDSTINIGPIKYIDDMNIQLSKIAVFREKVLCNSVFIDSSKVKDMSFNDFIKNLNLKYEGKHKLKCDSSKLEIDFNIGRLMVSSSFSDENKNYLTYDIEINNTNNNHYISNISFRLPSN